MAQLQAVEIPVTHGRLEGLLRWEDQHPGTTWLAAALICHPHPQFGGTMHTKVVAAAAKALNSVGIPVLRFNFRGVGRSTGQFDQGRGEGDDVRAALDWLAEHFPQLDLWLGGFSFGAWVGLTVGANDLRVQRLIGLGVPVAMYAMTALDHDTRPKLIIQGTEDIYGPPEQLLPWFDRLAPPRSLLLVEGSDHFFNGHLEEVSQALISWARLADPQ